MYRLHPKIARHLVAVQVEHVPRLKPSAFLQTAPIGTEDYSKPITAAQFHQVLEHYPLGEAS